MRAVKLNSAFSSLIAAMILMASLLMAPGCGESNYSDTGNDTDTSVSKTGQYEGYVREHWARFLTWKSGHEKLLKSFFPWADCYAKRNECWRAGLSVVCRLPALGSIKPGRTYALPPFLGGVFLYKKSIVRLFHQRHAKTIAFLPETNVLALKAVSAGFDEILTNNKIVS